MGVDPVRSQDAARDGRADGRHGGLTTTGTTNWASIARLYDGLVVLDPSTGTAVAHAAAIAEARGPTAGLAALVGRGRRRRLTLTNDPAVADHIRSRYVTRASPAD